MALAQHLDRMTRLIDWFIPAELAAHRESREKARIFLYSHVCGPFIGCTVPLLIWWFEGHSDNRALLLLASVLGFWIFPPLLRTFGHYYLLSVVSIQNLIFVILCSCYFYGGLSAPTVAWILTIPLLAFMYVGSSARMRAVLIAQFFLNALIYYTICETVTPPDVVLTKHALQVLGLVSTAAAAAYVAMMALFYANALASQVELQSAMEGHLLTAADLLSATEDARRFGAAKSDFIAKMSHELRTPLNAIIGYSEILLDDAEADSDPTSANDLTRIREAGLHLLRLVNKILDLSRIEAGRMEIVADAVDCGDLVETVGRDFSAIAEKNGCVLSCVRGADLGLVSTDAHKLKQVLSYLIENAAQHARGAAIVVSASRGVGELLITVADTGPGIAPDLLPNLLKNFDSLEHEKENRSGGAGLGLPLSKRLCDLLGARLSVESKLGAGATFTVALPTESESAPTSEREMFAQAEQGLKSLIAVRAELRAKVGAEPGGVDDAEAVVG